MAQIKKNGARKSLENATPFAEVSNHTADGGLRFKMQIGLHTVSLTQYERDILNEKWAQMQMEHESADSYRLFMAMLRLSTRIDR